MDTDKAARILRLWLGIEYLSPNTVQPQSIFDHRWSIYTDEEFPWNDQTKILPSDKGMTWRHFIHAGLVDTKEITRALQHILGHENINETIIEENSADDPAAIIGVNVNYDGMVIGDPSIASFPWAMNRIIQAGQGPIDFDGFEGPEGFEGTVRSMVRDLFIQRQLLAPDEENQLEHHTSGVQLRPLSCEDLEVAVNLVLNQAGWRPGTLLEDSIRLTSFITSIKKSGEPPDVDMLNSFVASDISRVRRSILENDYGEGLAQYLFGSANERVNVVKDGGTEIAATVQPRNMPTGRWPSKYPLALAQQYSVNKIFELSKENGIFSVNGPPGTGKTTLLRDVIAALIVERAKNIVKFDNPKEAFLGKFPVDGNDYPGWNISPSICGFGMVVASSNNGAVENITKELPSNKSINAPDISIDYFAAVAESLLAPPRTTVRDRGSCWGLIAAALGNKSRRGTFNDRFWFTKPADPSHDDMLVSFLTAIKNQDDEVDWAVSCQKFRDAVRAADLAIEQRQNDALYIAELNRARRSANEVQAEIDVQETKVGGFRQSQPAAITELDEARATLNDAQDRLDCRTLLQTTETRLESLDRERPTVAKADLERSNREAKDEEAKFRIFLDAAQQRSEVLRMSPPGFFRRLFNPASVRKWKQESLELIGEVARHKLKISEIAQHIVKIETSIRQSDKWQDDYAIAEQSFGAAKHAALELFGDEIPSFATLNDHLSIARQHFEVKQYQEKEIRAAIEEGAELIEDLSRVLMEEIQRIATCTEYLSAHEISDAHLSIWALSDMSEENRQRAAPWYDPELDAVRYAVFVEAMNLHKAFIIENRGKFTNNLSHFVNLMGGNAPKDSTNYDPSPFWETLFLVVPVVSTTFASSSRLFANMGRESLGWLLIDEAGQATPQAAVGAIWRAKRTVVVGDPLQIEPVVTIPAAIIEALQQREGIENNWNPALYSAQVLADRANIFGTYIGDDWVGSPLRVHRRCLDPMFNIANQIAYENLMVYDTQISEEDQAKEWLGVSCWFDIPGNDAEGHWIPKQGELTLALVQKIIEQEGLYSKSGKANVYVISPFKKVSKKMREKLDLIIKGDSEKVCGTVHTFQGREAPVVILLLGGDPTKPGAISSFAAAKPNILNVALTRAQQRIYVVGDIEHWGSHPYFSVMASQLPLGQIVEEHESLGVF